MYKNSTGDAVRNEDPSSWKRNRIYENTSAHGDQYVTVQIEGAEISESEAKQKLKEFEAACGQTDRYRNSSVA